MRDINRFMLIPLMLFVLNGLPDTSYRMHVPEGKKCGRMRAGVLAPHAAIDQPGIRTGFLKIVILRLCRGVLRGRGSGTQAT